MRLHEVKSGDINGSAKANGKNGHSHLLEGIDIIGDSHVATSIETPMKEGAFNMSDHEKVKVIEEHFEKIMDTLGLDLSDDSLRGTPHRVAKMFVKEIFHGLKPENKPRISVFDNKFNYGEMLVEKNIKVTSTCEHHFLPIIGKAHVAYVSSGKVIGLSKLNRIVDYFARRPQVQERMTVQIAEMLKEALNTEDVAVLIDAAHMCVACRGIQDQDSTTITAEYSGKFREPHVRKEFLQYVNMELKK
jgi:GTP cyclohydrolase I